MRNLRFLASLAMTTVKLGMVSAALAAIASQLHAQNPSADISVPRLAIRLASVPAVTGYEQAMVDTLLRLLPSAVRDRAGNARFQLGGGRARRLVVCPLDEPGYVVGGVRDDGYLTLRSVPGEVPLLFDQQLEGHRVTIQGRQRLVPGVVAVRSIHLTRGREELSEAPFTVDGAYVDVGSSSRAGVRALGIEVLSPVTLTKRPHRYGTELLAAPVVGRRAACAALFAAVRRSTLRAKLLPPVTVAFVTQQRLGERGLRALANELGPFEETLIVDAQPGARGSLQQRPDTDTSPERAALGGVSRWSLPVTYAGTPVETVSLEDAELLSDALVKWIGGDR